MGDVPDVRGSTDVPAIPEGGADNTATAESEPQGPSAVAEVELGEDDYGGDDLFDDIEEPTEESTGEGGSSTDYEAASGTISTAITEGSARLAVVGLEDDEKDELQSEFEDVFQAFQLGHYAGSCADKYLLTDPNENIDPAWGLLGSALVCSAVVLWMRPDGDEQIERLKGTLGGGGE